jgi:HSP20 family molecular chaperone IbpA
MERIYGTFSRDFPVPASLDPAAIKATLRAGVLRVVAPKAERGQNIPVESRAAEGRAAEQRLGESRRGR